MQNIAFALLLLFSFVFAGCGDKPEAKTNSTTSITANGADAAIPVELQNIPKPDKKQICLDSLEQQKQSYRKLFDEKSYLEAANAVRQCAKDLENQELLKLVAEADIENYRTQADNTNSSIPLRLRAMNQLIAEYPEAGERYKTIRDELEEFAYSKWEYSTIEDPMTSRKTRIARIDSSNEIYLDSPYEGAQKGTLQLREHPRFGKDVIIRVREGQIICSSYRGCSVLVRFDENEPQKYSAAESSDSDPTILFLNNYDRFIDNLLKSKRVRISIEFFHNGIQMLEFDVAGFDRERYPVPVKKKSKK